MVQLDHWGKEHIIHVDIVDLGGQIMDNDFVTNSEKWVIKRIIEIIEQDGDDVSDGECIDQIVQWLKFNGYEVLGL